MSQNSENGKDEASRPPSIPADIWNNLQAISAWTRKRSGSTEKDPVARERGTPLGFRFRANARVSHVEDGDTLKGVLSPFPGVTYSGPLYGYWRLPRVDTHETDADSKEKRQKAKREKKFVEEWVQKGREDYSPPSNAPEWLGEPFPFYVEFESVEVAGTYGRLLVDVIRKSDGEELNDRLLSEFDGIRYKPNS